MTKFVQKEFKIKPYSRGFHLITGDILSRIPELSTIKTGMCQVFIKHTSASLTINENADPTVRKDFESSAISPMHQKSTFRSHLKLKSSNKNRLFLRYKAVNLCCAVPANFCPAPVNIQPYPGALIFGWSIAALP